MTSDTVALSLNGNNFGMFGTTAEDWIVRMAGVTECTVVDGWISAGQWRMQYMSWDQPSSNDVFGRIEGTDSIGSRSACLGLDGDWVVGSQSGDKDFNLTLSVLYISDEAVDFSDEANRLMFVDGLGWPRDLAQGILDGDIPEPLVYLRYEDQTDFGVNSGTGADFVETGSILSGRDAFPEGLFSPP